MSACRNVVAAGVRCAGRGRKTWRECVKDDMYELGLHSDTLSSSISIQYADDTQLYIGTNLSTLAHQVASIKSCTQRVHNGLLNNGLHLNPSKSEALLFSTQGPNLLNP